MTDCNRDCKLLTNIQQSIIILSILAQFDGKLNYYFHYIIIFGHII